MKKIIILLLCLVAFKANAQNQVKARVDSLKAALPKTRGNERAVNLNRIASLYTTFNLDSALLYANKSLKFSTQQKNYTQLAIAYNYLGQIMYFKSDYTASLANFEKFKLAAIQANNNVLLAQAINNMANVLLDRGKTEEAIQKYQEVVAIAKKNNDKKGEALGYANLAYVYRFMGNNQQAITYIFEQIKLDELTKNVEGLAHSYQQLAVLFQQKKDYPNTKLYLDLSILKFKERGDERSIAINYDLYSSYYASLKNQKKAIELEKMALALATKYDDKRTLANCYIKLGQLYHEEGNYELADKNFREGLKIHEETNLQKTMATAYIGYGKNLIKLKNLEQAKANLDKGLALAIKLKSAVDKKDAYEALIEYYLIVNAPEKAIQSQNNFIAVKDSLLNESNNKIINELNTIYKTEKKEQQILLLDKQNVIQGLELNKSKLEFENKSLENDKNIFKIGAQELLLQKNKLELARKQIETKAKAQQIKLLAAQNQVQQLQLIRRNIFLATSIGILLVSLLLSYLFYNRYKLKQEARLQEEVIVQQDLATKAVLNAEENERIRISGELHDGLGQLFSAVKLNLSALMADLDFKNEQSRLMFDKTLGMVDESCKEVRVISHQMAPNVLLKSGLTAAVRDFINKIDSRRLKINLETFGLQERLEQNIETVLYRIIQETVNNVIKHAGANTLDIQLNKDEEGINVMVEDNGKGFDTSQLEKFEGIGLKNIRTRVNFLKGTVDFSSGPGKGTLIAIFIPS
jgi:two-component system NarL family sensor kinase